MQTVWCYGGAALLTVLPKEGNAQEYLLEGSPVAAIRRESLLSFPP